MDSKLHQVEIIKLLTPYLMAFPQSKMNEGGLVVYAKALEPLSIAEIEAAMLKLMRTSEFFPTVAEIFKAAENIQNFVTKNETKTAGAAWEEVIKQVHDAFVYRKPTFSDKTIEKVALSMGWTSLCELPVDGMNTARAQFMRIYETELTRAKDRMVNTAVLNTLPAEKVQALMHSTGSKLSLVSGGKA